MRNLILILLLALAGPALAQSYTPIQPTHWGNWYTPAASGEGIELSAIDGEDGVTIFANVYLLAPDPYWASAQASAHDAWRPDLGEYELVLFNRDAVNGSPISVGSLWLKPNLSGQLRWRVLMSEPAVLREAFLSQLTMPIVEQIGVCGMVGFPPYPPQAAPRFCH